MALELKADTFQSYKLFSSFRENTSLSYFKKDHTLFFSAVIASRLIRFQNEIPMECKENSDYIIKEIQKSSVQFKNKYGGLSYNFWRTNPSGQFPGDPFLSQNKAFHIPDDADDTALLLLVNQNEIEKIKEFKKLLDENIPGKKRKIANSLTVFNKMKTYSTWIGERMPPEYDFCVLANVLYLLSEYKIPFSEYDSAAIQFINKSLQNEYFIGKPHRISPQYKSETASIYHYSFLVSKHPIKELVELKPQLIERIRHKLSTEVSRLEKNMLIASLAYLGEFKPFIEIKENPEKKFYFFYANMGSVAPNPFQGPLSQFPMLSFGYICPALEKLFELETLLLYKKKNRN